MLNGQYFFQMLGSLNHFGHKNIQKFLLSTVSNPHAHTVHLKPSLMGYKSPLNEVPIESQEKSIDLVLVSIFFNTSSTIYFPCDFKQVKFPELHKLP